ncbi:MAG: HAMP domain-containing sensor histidine kinase [Peptococcaceae bacterium]|nr:HAMP domain-containing sensor histidine kinase [Peptococcaceae bacterium]
MKLFDQVAGRTAYALAVDLAYAPGIWLAAAYGFFIIAAVPGFRGQLLRVLLLSTVAGVVAGSLSRYVQCGLLQRFGFPGYPGNIKMINRMLHGNYPLRDTSSFTDRDLLRLLRAVERLPLDNARGTGLYTFGIATFVALMVGVAGSNIFYTVIMVGVGIVVTVIHTFFTFIVTEYYTGPLITTLKKSLHKRGVGYPDQCLFSLRTKAYYLLFLIALSMGILTFIITGGASGTDVAAFLLIGMLTHGLIIYALWKTFATSLQQIGRAAAELASGGEGVFFPASTDEEIITFSTNYNLAAAEVNSLRACLEQNVVERTAELEQVRETLEIQNQRLVLSNQRLQELDRVKSAFLSGVSHELRTPLTSVLGFAMTTRKRFGEAVVPRLEAGEKKLARAVGQISGNLDIIVREAEKLATLVDEVMDLAKMEGDGARWRNEPLRVGEVVGHAVAAAEPLVRTKGLELAVDIEPGLPEVMGDPDRLGRVVSNLLANAVKFTSRGSVACVVRGSGEGVTVRVTDTGIGIPRQEWDKVFEDFRQLGDTLTAKPAGTGLGLAIARRIVQRHGGRIWLTSEPGRGSTFSFCLPAAGRLSNASPSVRPGEQQEKGVLQPVFETQSLHHVETH